MGITIGTDARSNVPIRFRFIYGGNTVGWGQPFKINGLSNSGESVDGDYKISDLDLYLSDRYGSIFTNHFGNGTTGFGTPLQVVAYLGGTMEYVASGIATSFLPIGTAGAYAATLHTGKIYGLSYKDRMLRVRSKSKMAHLKDLKYQFPVYSFGFNYTVYGSFAFANYNLGTRLLGQKGFYDFEDSNTKWKCQAYVLATSFGPNGYLHTNGFPKMAGRGTGTLPITGDDEEYYYYAGTNSGGTNFYSAYEPISLNGTFLGIYNGTITTDAEAQEYGYLNTTEAEGSSSSQGTYPIYKTRLKSNDPYVGSYFHFTAPIVIDGTPKEMFEYLIYGAMVTPLFTSSDVDTTTLNETENITAFFGLQRKAWFKEKNVLDDIKDLIETTQSLFSVNTSDKFELRAYGPKNLQTSMPTIGTDDIISSEFNNYEDDYYNRILVNYKWDGLEQDYTAVYEEKTSNWSLENDRPLVLESKFIRNPNEAVIVTQRIRSKYERTFPHVNFTTNLNHLGIDIGTLLRITDPNSGLNGKIIQVSGYIKDWASKTIQFEAYDGETLYQRRGYGQWDDGTLSVLPGGTINGTSTFGWGTTDWQGINTTLYGTSFVWW